VRCQLRLCINEEGNNHTILQKALTTSVPSSVYLESMAEPFPEAPSSGPLPGFFSTSPAIAPTMAPVTTALQQEQNWNLPPWLHFCVYMLFTFLVLALMVYINRYVGNGVWLNRHEFRFDDHSFALKKQQEKSLYCHKRSNDNCICTNFGCATRSTTCGSIEKLEAGRTKGICNEHLENTGMFCKWQAYGDFVLYFALCLAL
jgi:hypothetical protein